MLLRDWIDAAWAKILDSSPSLSNPFEYQKTMYRAFWLGEGPEEKPAEEETAAEQSRRIKESIGKPPPKAVLDEYEQLRARVQAKRQVHEESAD